MLKCVNDFYEELVADATPQKGGWRINSVWKNSDFEAYQNLKSREWADMKKAQEYDKNK